MSRTPAPEVIVDAPLVAALVAEQFPHLAQLPVSLLGNGWDNWMFRLGDALCVRLPRRALAVELLDNEREFLPLLAQRLPIPVPAPLHCGKPSTAYRWPWLITPWFPGGNADQHEPAASEAVRLASFLTALHRSDCRTAPFNAHRGVPLPQRNATLQPAWSSLAALGEPLDPALGALWDRACAAPYSDKAVWLHGDLHYANVLIERGRFTAIVDWGDMCSGDPATDLAAIWLLFGDAPARNDAMAAYGGDAVLRLRAMGWALSFATVLRASGLADNPRHAAVGRAVMGRLLADLAQT